MSMPNIDAPTVIGLFVAGLGILFFIGLGLLAWWLVKVFKP